MIVGVRELAKAELAQLGEGKRPKVPAVQRFRDSHHMLARLLACGLRYRQVSVISGYSEGRVQTLATDPAFQELVALYRKDKELEEATLGPLEALAAVTTSNTLKAARHLSDALDNADAEGETLPVRMALGIFSEGADRIGFGKRSTQVNVNVDFAAQLEKAIRRSGKGNGEAASIVRADSASETRGPQLIDITPARVRRI